MQQDDQNELKNEKILKRYVHEIKEFNLTRSQSISEAKYSMLDRKSTKVKGI